MRPIPPTDLAELSHEDRLLRAAWIARINSVRLSGDAAARPTTVSRAQHGAGRAVALGGDATDRTQDGGGLSPLRDHQRSRLAQGHGSPEWRRRDKSRAQSHRGRAAERVNSREFPMPGWRNWQTHGT